MSFSVISRVFFSTKPVCDSAPKAFRVGGWGFRGMVLSIPFLTF